MTKKNLLAFILAAILLCTVFALSACHNEADQGAQSSQTQSQEQEQSQPQTDQEKLDAALENCRSFFAAEEDVLGVSFQDAPDSGTMNLEMMLNKLIIQEQDLLGGNPLGAKETAKIANGIIQEDISLLCAGDTVPMTVWTDGTSICVEIPGVTEKPFSIPMQNAANDLPNTIDPDKLMKKLTDGLTEAFSGIYDPETDLTVTEEQESKTFSIHISGEKMKTLSDKLNELMQELTDELSGGLGGLGDVLPVASDHSEDTSGNDTDSDKYLTVVLTMQNDIPSSLDIVAHNADDTEAFSICAKVSVNGGITTLEITVKEEAETLLTCTETVTEKENELKYELTLKADEVKIGTSVTVSKEQESKIAFNGSLELTVQQNGMLVTIPLNFSGSYGCDGETLECTFNTELALKGLAEISLTLDARMEKGDVQVSMPTDVQPYEQVDMDALTAKLMQKYPNLARFLQGLDGGLSGDPDFKSYVDFDQTVEFDLYDDVVCLYARGIYVDNGSTLDFYNINEKKVYSLPYKENSDGSYTMFGVSFTPETDADPESTLSIAYEAESGYYSIALYRDPTSHQNEGEFNIGIAVPRAEQDGVFTITLPDGSTLPYSVTVNGDTAKIGDTTLAWFDAGATI